MGQNAGFWVRVKNLVGLADAADVAETAKPPKTERLVEAYGVNVDKDEDQWRKLTGDSNRDLSPITAERMREMAKYLWETNLLANRLIELPVAYMLAQGVQLMVEDEENQAILDRFWHDPINEMDIKLPKKIRELAMYGEQVYPVFVNEGDGHVRLGYLNPGLINTVVQDPDNAEQTIGIVLKKDRKDVAKRYRVIVNGPEDVFTTRTQEIRKGFTDGDVFFFKINDMSDGSRGRSDLLAQIDWLDAYDAYLFGELDRASFMRAFIWDVTLKGATEDEVKRRAKDMTAPSPGSVRVHNDSEEWKTESPSLQAADSSEMARLMRNHVLGGSTTPEHWFGGGGDVNRASAAEMGEPTFKMFSMRQRYVQHMLEMMGRYVLTRAAQIAKADAQLDFSLPENKVRAVFPEMVPKDTGKYATALSQCVVAAVAAVNAGLVQKSTAMKIVANVAANLGVEYDVEDEMNKVEEELLKAKGNDSSPPNLPGTEDPAPADNAKPATDNAASAT
jgi:hypothetical protein